MHQLGRFMASCESNVKGRPSAIISVPCLDYASVLIASGIISVRSENRDPVVGNLESWRNSVGMAVCFPRCRITDNDHSLYLAKGFVATIDSHLGKDRLNVKWVDKDNYTYNRAIDSRWLPLVIPINDNPVLERKKVGSILARHIKGLEKILGESGVCRLVQESHKDCSILDVKSRVSEEVKMRIPLSRLNQSEGAERLLLRDLVRLDVEGGEAMAETHCCRVANEPEDGWAATVLSGSLRFTRSWNDCDSSIRIGVISPIETNYGEAVEFANKLFGQREPCELDIPEALLKIIPRSVDMQMMYL